MFREWIWKKQKMKIKDNKAFTIYILLTLVIWQLAISLSKIFMNEHFFKRNEDLIFFLITETKNKGAAFGIFQDSSLILGVLGVVVILFCIFYVAKYISFQDKTKILSAAIFTSGILGNSVQRLFDGYVTDFIKLTFIDFPVFNLFDVLITSSVFIYIFFYLREEIIKRVKNCK